MTIAWQPTPPPTGEPAPGTVDRLCGQPLQNAAVRAGASWQQRELRTPAGYA